jgi:hypothetical protein
MHICGAITLRSVQSLGCTRHTCQADRSPLTTITDFLPTCLSDYHNNVLDWCILRIFWSLILRALRTVSCYSRGRISTETYLRSTYIAYGHNTSFLLQLFHSRLSNWVMFMKEFCSIVQKTLFNICSLLYRPPNIYTLQWVFLGLGMQTCCSPIQTHVFHSVKMVQSLLLSHFETIYILE